MALSQFGIDRPPKKHKIQIVGRTYTLKLKDIPETNVSKPNPKITFKNTATNIGKYQPEKKDIEEEIV